MTVYKQIDADQATELTDSIVVSISAENADTIMAGVSWSIDGDIKIDGGPLSVPEALDLARGKAAEVGKAVVYVVLQPDTVGWDVAWGSLQ